MPAMPGSSASTSMVERRLAACSSAYTLDAPEKACRAAAGAGRCVSSAREGVRVGLQGFGRWASWWWAAACAGAGAAWLGIVCKPC
jgi:hypothetical protein